VNQESDTDRQWDHGWEEHRRRQLQRWAALPLHVKLDWLEEAQALVDHLSAKAKEYRAARCPDTGPPTGQRAEQDHGTKG